MENDIEIWKDVIDYEGLYQVSNMGRIKDIVTFKLLKPVLEPRGYFMISLRKDKKFKNARMHTIVAKAFIDRNYINNGLVCNHKNFNKGDNRLVNLEVVTQRENSNKKHIKSSSKYTGVYWDRCIEKWIARIRIGKINKYLGGFENEKEAADACESALQYASNNDFNIDLLNPIIYSSKYKGVSFYKSRNRWCSYLYINNKRKHLGYYCTEEEAYDALKLAKKQINKQ